MITNRDERLDEIYAEIETGLKLVGSSAIEDRLQDAVAQTLQSLKSVGIKVWVLTGDKVETAINIGYSAGLLEKNMLIRVIEQSDLDEIKERKNEASYGGLQQDRRLQLLDHGPDCYGRVPGSDPRG